MGMPRSIRIEYVGAVYHVMCRGDRREAASRFGVTVSELWSRRQTDPVKQAVAWWVKSRSVVSDEWVSAKLEMGSRSNIHRAVKAYRAPRDRVRSRLKSELQLCAD